VGAIAAVAIWFVSEEFMYRLGDMYKKGEVFTKDVDKARNLYWIAAKMGNAWGMENLGELHENDAQCAKARDSYEEAANKCIAWGMFHLAGLYICKSVQRISEAVNKDHDNVSTNRSAT
jgi:TPR repeat protein